MFVEHEAKVLGIDPAAIRHKTVAAGGVCTVERQLTRRTSLQPRSHQENYRTSFTLHSAHLEVDTWPLVLPYLEVE